MKAAQLKYENAPRPSVVLGCLLPAPWLGAAAGLLVAFGPADGLPFRFSPTVLAAVHLLALGMLVPVMVGALFQMMPVVAGVRIRGTAGLAPLVALIAGSTALGLAGGFLTGRPLGFRVAIMLGAPFLSLVGLALLWAGTRVAAIDATTRTLACIGAALIATVATGAALAGALGGQWQVSLGPTLQLHVAVGLVGWLATLVAGVATTVVPMFWQTRRLPASLDRFLPWGIWLLLLGYCGVVIDLPQLAGAGAVPLLLFLAALAVVGLQGVLRARRRHDPGWRLWVAACLSALGAVALSLAAPALPGAVAYPWWIGTAVLVGCGVLPVTAMIGKIVPFLIWLRLRRRLPLPARIPAMQAMISPGQQRWQANLLLLAYVLLLALPLAPRWLALPGGALFAAANVWLGLQLLRAVRCFRRTMIAGGLPPRHPEA
ncbi:hypothetical protein P3W85_02200 [Cupriavidus basilensis]|uniref:Transmembrane protein n=1 Tax=Cupriavidus basilensis TaxID=68895 RepID=A0ABT6AJ14_9BURK|nr:hypothetical protein [Cupriavidus basilensis]MDF3831776.1 hypothetical protein [Cupriavidus basilensis]